MRYADAVQQLYGLSARGMRPGIERMQASLVSRGLTTARLPPFIQVAGTNGKGSVSSMVEAGLREAGYHTGLFTSPHLHRVTERVRIDGEPIATREAARRITELLRWAKRKSSPEVSFFELGTLLAVEAFRDHGCDIAVLEVGLGGRLDATTALPANLSAITRIAFDHMNLLGHSLRAIAAEKAGIIRPGVPVIVGSRGAEVQRVIRQRARELQAPLHLIERDFKALPAPGGKVGFEVAGREIKPLRLGLLGAHQLDNAAVAAAVLCALGERGYPVSPAALRRGLSGVRWPARLERVAGSPTLLFDAAHNPDGARALAAYLTNERRRPRVLVFGVMEDKDFPRMLKLLAAESEQRVYFEPAIARAARVDVLQRVAAGTAARSAADALAKARALAGPRGLVVCAGSIFAVSELRARALRLPSDPLIRM